MQTLLKIPEAYHHIAPDGAEVRELMENMHGGIAHCILKADIVSLITQHRTVSEFWYILSGKGEIWRKNGSKEEVTPLSAGVTLEIPVGTIFQYRSSSDLHFIIVTMPPWSGMDEAIMIDQGKWNST